MDHLSRLPKDFSVPIPRDEQGYTGRQCPNEGCKGFFKVMFGTGLPGEIPCHCPYCGHAAPQHEFDTEDQIEYGFSVVNRQVMDAIEKDLKALEFDHAPKGPFGIGISMKLQPGPRVPIHRYREPSLETFVECSNCSLKYAVFGVFAFCPDCGEHNSLQILGSSFETVGKLLRHAQGLDGDLRAWALDNALEDVVSVFDSFGRELCKVHAALASDPEKARCVSFQSLEGAMAALKELFGLDVADALTDEEWQTCKRGFQKRHVIAHKLGVADEAFVRRANMPAAALGRKIESSPEDVVELMDVLKKLAGYLHNRMGSLRK